jgi:hypothetical protein
MAPRIMRPSFSHPPERRFPFCRHPALRVRIGCRLKVVYVEDQHVLPARNVRGLKGSVKSKAAFALRPFPESIGFFRRLCYLWV